MPHKCYISFKRENMDFKAELQYLRGLEMIDKSLDEPIESENEDYIMQRIRSEYLADSTVTIHLIGRYGAETRGWHEQRFIKRELQGSLYNSPTNTKNGILGVVLPEMADRIYRGSYECSQCGRSHNHVAINNETTVSEFSYNYYIPNNKCFHAEEDRYCVLVTWNNFIANPTQYVESAFAKRTAPIAAKTKVRP
jgi:hypothetical protein